MIFLMHCCIWFANILLRILASMIVSDIGLLFSFFVVSLSGFKSKIILDQKTMAHLHNGILHSREKEGAYTLCSSMDGTGEHYVK